MPQAEEDDAPTPWNFPGVFYTNNMSREIHSFGELDAQPQFPAR